MRDGTDRSQPLPVVALLVRRNREDFLLPDEDFLLDAGDQLLLASPLAARHNLELTLHNPNELDYVLTGEEISGSWLWNKWLAHKKAVEKARCA